MNPSPEERAKALVDNRRHEWYRWKGLLQSDQEISFEAIPEESGYDLGIIGEDKQVSHHIENCGTFKALKAKVRQIANCIRRF